MTAPGTPDGERTHPAMMAHPLLTETEAVRP